MSCLGRNHRTFHDISEKITEPFRKLTFLLTNPFLTFFFEGEKNLHFRWVFSEEKKSVQNIDFFFGDELGLGVLAARLDGEHPGLSLAEVPGGTGPMAPVSDNSSVLSRHKKSRNLSQYIGENSQNLSQETKFPPA